MNNLARCAPTGINKECGIGAAKEKDRRMHYHYSVFLANVGTANDRYCTEWLGYFETLIKTFGLARINQVIKIKNAIAASRMMREFLKTRIP